MIKSIDEILREIRKRPELYNIVLQSEEIFDYPITTDAFVKRFWKDARGAEFRSKCEVCLGIRARGRGNSQVSKIRDALTLFVLEVRENERAKHREISYRKNEKNRWEIL